jgi:hypothetical protein
MTCFIYEHQREGGGWPSASGIYITMDKELLMSELSKSINSHQAIDEFIYGCEKKVHVIKNGKIAYTLDLIDLLEVPRLDSVIVKAVRGSIETFIDGKLIDMTEYGNGDGVELSEYLEKHPNFKPILRWDLTNLLQEQSSEWNPEIIHTIHKLFPVWTHMSQLTEDSDLDSDGGFTGDGSKFEFIEITPEEIGKYLDYFKDGVYYLHRVKEEAEESEEEEGGKEFPSVE